MVRIKPEHSIQIPIFLNADEEVGELEDSDNGQAVENEDEYIVNHSEGWHGCVIVNTDDSSSAEDKFAKE
ncbi:hypothetical protein MUCCIDRAFT_112421 [Mucor lusitanicus CBS 277.49]|uniref:Uncharacterized protein n=1 Tax=Mucor lusitanicus CBS 277.49 TaxID=747725 RepID=A0A168JBK6_MUCCL|nr:hypothetical protein MUCCIDRAFT_112421 [Mucor lusitanicus CBS 277.49]